MIKFYGYKKCGTCRKAEKYLEQKNIAYEFIDITENPPNQKTLKSIADLAGVDPKKLFNTSGIQYRELKIKEKLPTLTNGEIFKMLAGNGRLIKRPLITDGERATVGFNEALFGETWS
ncbi:MAG: arsenate reductase family protein [Gammaproteobacteria bacterium]